MLTDIDPFTATAAQLLSVVVDMEPGPFALSILLMVDRASLGPEDAVTFLQVHERITSWWASVQTEALVAAAGDTARVDEFWLQVPGTDEQRRIRIEDAAREEVAAAVRWAPATTQARIDSARLLAGPLRDTWDALALGEISTGHVSVIVEAARRFDGAWADTGPDCDDFRSACARLQQRVLPVARRGTLSATRAAVNRAVLVIDAQGARRRREAARCTRGVHVVDELDGISVLVARMATVDAHAVMAAVEARAVTEDAGTVGERRSMALADLALGRRADGRSSAAGVMALDVVVDLHTLMGLDDAPASLAGDGSGAVAVEAADVRALIASLAPDTAVAVRRVIVDDVDGHVIDVGRSRYVAPQSLRALVVRRDVTCRFPGCRRRADLCQIDHATAWDDGGTTDRANLGALCTRHHQLKTHGGWRITRSAADGSCAWESPQGRAYERGVVDIRGST